MCFASVDEDFCAAYFMCGGVWLLKVSDLVNVGGFPGYLVLHPAIIQCSSEDVRNGSLFSFLCLW